MEMTEEVSTSRCGACASALAHCHATLVVHADGGVECEESGVCGADPALHEWWLACVELEPACGCTGDEQPLPWVEMQAA
jgi:hypothetical protein